MVKYNQKDKQRGVFNLCQLHEKVKNHEEKIIRLFFQVLLFFHQRLSQHKEAVSTGEELHNEC